MSKKIDLKKQPTPINLVDWIGLYDTKLQENYALEFLTAVTYNDLSISDAERYQLPSDVEDLDPKKRESIKRWEQGAKPRAIKGLDELRKTKNPEFRLDLLKPGLYNGTEITGNNLPYAIDILPGLVYLYISVLISGCSTEDNSYSQFNPKGKITIYPSRRLPRKQLEAKLQGVYTENRGRAEIGLKQPYAHLLQLLGMPQGKIVELDYEELGLDFIEKLILWTKKERLNKSDNKHAMNALYKVIEAFIDHRYTTYTIHDKEKEFSTIFTPGFRKKKTSSQFSEFFLDVWKLVNPDIPVRHNPIKIKKPTKLYHSGFHPKYSKKP